MIYAKNVWFFSDGRASAALRHRPGPRAPRNRGPRTAKNIGLFLILQKRLKTC